MNISVIRIDRSNGTKTYNKQMHVANCEYLLISISCEMNADQSLFVVDLNERRSYSTNLLRSITGGLKSV